MKTFKKLLRQVRYWLHTEHLIDNNDIVIEDAQPGSPVEIEPIYNSIDLVDVDEVHSNCIKQRSESDRKRLAIIMKWMIEMLSYYSKPQVEDIVASVLAFLLNRSLRPLSEPLPYNPHYKKGQLTTIIYTVCYRYSSTFSRQESVSFAMLLFPAQFDGSEFSSLYKKTHRPMEIEELAKFNAL